MAAANMVEAGRHPANHGCKGIEGDSIKDKFLRDFFETEVATLILRTDPKEKLINLTRQVFQQ